jgi:hypothetical protein
MQVKRIWVATQAKLILANQLSMFAHIINTWVTLHQSFQGLSSLAHGKGVLKY